ncbi:MAG: alpha/beta family hydrolase, partial [Acidobacteriota bacterium]
MQREIRVEIATGTHLVGDLVVPQAARGVVLFAHGSGSSRHSSRNQYVASELQKGGMATLLIDLLTAEEEREDMRGGHLRFDIGLLADRLFRASEWLAAENATRTLRIGLFGASTGGGAALVAAARQPERIAAVVSRGGRPDLAGEALAQVLAPTLLLVGGRDTPVIDMNRDAYERLSAVREMTIIPGASHLFEEPGTLEQVSRLARTWFERYLEVRDDNE